VEQNGKECTAKHCAKVKHECNQQWWPMCAMTILTADQQSFFSPYNLANKQPHLNLVRGVFLCFK